LHESSDPLREAFDKDRTGGRPQRVAVWPEAGDEVAPARFCMLLLTAAKGENPMYRVLPILLVALAVMLLTSAPVVFAADDVTVEGKVVKAADGKLTITDKDSKEHTFAVAADAKIECDGKVCKLEDLKKDVQVKATAKKDGDKTTIVKIDATTK
jgi:biopolymer transport protein ExbD